MQDALVDLSNICHAGQADPSWARYEAVGREWRRSGGSRVRAIGDLSLRHQLAEPDVGKLRAAQRRGEVELVPFADPHLLTRALPSSSTSLISNDRFRDHQVEFPELVGFDRLYTVHWSAVNSPRLEREVVQAAPEASRLAEKAELKRLGFRPGTAGDLELLRWDWRCDTRGCQLAVWPQLEQLPRCDFGEAVCPDCGESLRRLGYAGGGIEIKLGAGGRVMERLALADGASVTLGRGSSSGTYDISHLLEPSESQLVSRDHVFIENRRGRLRVEDRRGSRNGTAITGDDGSRRLVPPNRVIALQPGDVLELADVLTVARSKRRWPRARSWQVEPKLHREAPPTSLGRG
jgi:hypothetical protein